MTEPVCVRVCVCERERERQRERESEGVCVCVWFLLNEPLTTQETELKEEMKMSI